MGIVSIFTFICINGENKLKGGKKFKDIDTNIDIDLHEGLGKLSIYFADDEGH